LGRNIDGAMMDDVAFGRMRGGLSAIGSDVPDVVPSSTHAVALGAILIQPATDLPLFSDRVSQ
jgi:hypothetical protein